MRQKGSVSLSPSLRWWDDLRWAGVGTHLISGKLDGQGLDLSRILELDDTPYSIARASHEPAVRGYVQEETLLRREARQGSAYVLGFE